MNQNQKSLNTQAFLDIIKGTYHREKLFQEYGESKKTYATWGPSSIYYYRIPISEIDSFNMNGSSLRFTPDLNSKSQKRYSTISINLIVLVFYAKNLRKRLIELN